MAGKTSFVTMMSACLIVVVLVVDGVQPDRKSIISGNESLAVFAITEKTVLLRKRSFPLKKAGEADETGYYSFANNDNAMFGLIFGHLLFKAKNGDIVTKCEGVLIGPKHVLSVYPDCILTDANRVEYQFTTVTDVSQENYRPQVNVISIWRNKGSQYIVALLEDHWTLLNMNVDKFPWLSWTKQDGINNYGLFPEMADNYPVLLSTLTVNQDLNEGTLSPEVHKFFAESQYLKPPVAETLSLMTRASCNENRPPPSKRKNWGYERKTFEPLNGASFFKPLSNGVALLGLTSMVIAGQCDRNDVIGKLNTNGPTLRRLPSTEGKEACCFSSDRWGWRDVQNLYQIGLAVDGTMPTDKGTVFPETETEPVVIGSWNMQSLARMNEDRPLSPEVYEALLNVIKETQILALQEVYNFEEKYKGTSKPLNSLRRLRTEEGINYMAEGEFAFVYDSSKVELANQNEKCGFLETANHKYAYWCKFQFNGAKECFTMYTAHFRESSRTVRASEFRHFREHSNRVRADGAKTCGRIQIIAGDFNFRNAGEQLEVASNFVDFRLLDAGPTTVAKRKSHYDRILVSETLRLPHHYIYPGWKTAAGPTQSIELHEPYSQKFNQKDDPKFLRSRRYKPVVRSYELSDHLPVQMSWEGLNIGTWNMGKQGSFADSKLRDVYTKVFSLFSVLAVQEVSGEVYQKDSNTPKSYGRAWRVSRTLNRERLGFAYDSDEVDLDPDSCTDFTLAMENYNNQRSAYACVFKKKKNQKVLVVVNVHLLNKPKPTVKYVDKLIDHIRSMNKWKDAYIMGDFNADDIKNKWKSSNKYLFKECIHSDRVPFDPVLSWTFTRIASKKTLDYIFTPELAIMGDNTPGSFRCRVIHPELEKDNREFIIENANSLTPYRFIGTWEELSDHYPVFMQFKPPRDPGGTVDEKRKNLGVKRMWPLS